MIAGSLLVGLHMAATHGVMQGMMSSAIPAGEVPGLGRISGTVWSVTDLILGTTPPSSSCPPARPRATAH